MEINRQVKISKFMKDTENKAESLWNYAWKQGYKQGREDGEQWYKNGLKDAFLSLQARWEDSYCSAKEMFEQPVDQFLEKFGYYEEKAEEEPVEIGDEVKDENGLLAIVTNTDTHYHLLYRNGKTWKAPKSHKLEKTGKRIRLWTENMTPELLIEDYE